jgi:triosephosphate isomerase
MRDLIIAGNWKMNKDLFETEAFCHDLALYLKHHDEERVKPVVAPVFPCLAKAQEILLGMPAQVAGQDVSAHESGAYTGEVSAAQLRSLGLGYCIIGHSERRQYHGESDALIREKMLRLFEAEITPILCLGETLGQREEGRTEEVVVSQLEGCFQDIALRTGKEVVIAYEPVWAIGTGRTATSAQAQEVHALIRGWLVKRYSPQIAEQIHILYGGSAKPDNIRELLSQPDIDGGLIGGASLKTDDFCAMISIAVEVAEQAKR